MTPFYRYKSNAYSAFSIPELVEIMSLHLSDRAPLNHEAIDSVSPSVALKSMVHDAKIHHQFESVAMANPQAIALVDADRTWRYTEVNTLSHGLAACLQSMTTADVSMPVAIYGKRSAWLVIAMLACAKAGRCFAVLDSAYPSDRINVQIDIISPCLIIGVNTDAKELSEKIGDTGDLPLIVANSDEVEHFNKLSNIKLEPIDNPLAYLLFTSGTTGKPKCIQTSHAPLIHFVDFYLKQFSPCPTDHFSMLSGLGHDPIFRDIFVPLSLGAKLCIPTHSIITQPILLFNWIQEQQISFLHATPQLLKLILAGAKGQIAPSLRCIFSGGDVLRQTLVREISTLSPGCQVTNFYGATETPQAVAFHVVADTDEEIIPIGKGISDTQILILNEDFVVTAPGEIGQIAVRSSFRSNGYLGDESQTMSKFVKSPFTNQVDDLLYLSGDYGYYRNDRAVIIKGRLDDQVKIRGFRVELVEITLAIEAIQGIEACTVLAQSQSNGENSLTAYLVGKKEVTPGLEQIKSELNAHLPSYMVPGRFVWVESLPLLPNGKIDRERLLQLGNTSEFNNLAMNGENQDGKIFDDDSISSVQDEKLLEDFKSIFSVGNINLSNSFEDLGGDSLSYIQASMALEKNLGYLPENWEKTPLSLLLKCDRVNNPKSYSINTSVIVRAISIVIIVLSHYSNFGLWGNLSATTPMFVIAGWSFVRYQIDPILKHGRINHVLNMIVAIAVPTILYTMANQAYKGDIHWDTVFLIGNFSGENYAYKYGYWFIGVLVQVLLALMLFFSIPAIRVLMDRQRFLFICVATLLFGSAINLSYSMSWLDYERLGLFLDGVLLLFLGMAVGLANTIQKKIIVMMLVLALQLIGMLSWYPFVAISFVLLISRVSLPIWLARAIGYVATSSLFIYLTHNGLKAMLLDKIGVSGNLFLSVGFAVLFGLVVWKMWTYLWSLLMGTLNRKVN